MLVTIIFSLFPHLQITFRFLRKFIFSKSHNNWVLNIYFISYLNSSNLCNVESVYITVWNINEKKSDGYLLVFSSLLMLTGNVDSHEKKLEIDSCFTPTQAKNCLYRFFARLGYGKRL